MIVLLTLNGTLGFVEARKAGDAVAALKKSLAPKCRVYRDGAMREMDASLLVPGDRVMIKLGDIIPADGKLLVCGPSHPLYVCVCVWSATTPFRRVCVTGHLPLIEGLGIWGVGGGAGR